MKYLLAFLIFSMLSLGPTGLGNEKNEADADATGVCNHSPDIPLETTGDARQFCSRFRGFCESTKVAFLADGFACNWKCRSWWGDPGRKGSSCQWDCKTPLPPHTWGTYGAGPKLAFLNIRECDSLAGRQVVEGFAMDLIRGVATLNFFWNGTPIEPISLQMRLPSAEACSLPMGSNHAHCFRESGFTAEIDTTQLPDGPGSLALVASDFNGWTSKLELNVVIANRVDSSARQLPGLR